MSAPLSQIIKEIGLSFSDSDSEVMDYSPREKEDISQREPSKRDTIESMNNDVESKKELQLKRKHESVFKHTEESTVTKYQRKEDKKPIQHFSNNSLLVESNDIPVSTIEEIQGLLEILNSSLPRIELFELIYNCINKLVQINDPRDKSLTPFNEWLLKIFPNASIKSAKCEKLPSVLPLNYIFFKDYPILFAKTGEILKSLKAYQKASFFINLSLDLRIKTLENEIQKSIMNNNDNVINLIVELADIYFQEKGQFEEALELLKNFCERFNENESMRFSLIAHSLKICEVNGKIKDSLELLNKTKKLQWSNYYRTEIDHKILEYSRGFLLSKEKNLIRMKTKLNPNSIIHDLSILLLQFNKPVFSNIDPFEFAGSIFFYTENGEYKHIILHKDIEEEEEELENLSKINRIRNDPTYTKIKVQFDLEY